MRILIPFTLTKETPAGLWPDPTPLFEEECNLGGPALVTDFDCPFFGHGSRLRTALAADNNPIDSFKVDLPNRTKQGFERDKLNRRLRRLKMF